MSDSEEPHRAFRVLDGQWLESTKWLDFPPVIRARSPEDRSEFCRVRVSRTDATKAAEARRRQPAYDFWSVLCGKAPPLPHQEQDPDAGLTMLSDAVACFHGIKRPVAEDADGARYIAYVLKPTLFYVYEPRPPIMICRKEVVPSDLVFVAYVRLDEPGDRTIGVLTHWQFVEAHGGKGDLPVDFSDRYDGRRW